MTDLELGIDTFGDITADHDGRLVEHPQVIRNLVDEAVLGEQVGLDAFGLGEHHRPDFAVSAPEIVLAAIAPRTERIKLGTAVTVLSSDDPIRVFQRFATLDALSNGRAEVILGRGSFTESFPLFGHHLSDYEVLFEEKLDLFSHLLEEKPVTWRGTIRPSLDKQMVYPTTDNGLTAWVGVGGSPESVVRAARYDLPLVMAIIGGDPLRFAPFADLYRRAQAEMGHDPKPIGIHSPGYVADTDEQARDELWPHAKKVHDLIGGQRGWPPMTRAQFDASAGPNGALAVGSPQTVAAKLVRSITGLGAQRFSMKYSNGTLPHDRLMNSIELFGTKVAPLVREQVGNARAAAGGAVATL